MGANGDGPGGWKLQRVAEMSIMVSALGGAGVFGFGLVNHRLAELEAYAKQNADRVGEITVTMTRLEVVTADHVGQPGHAAAAADLRDLRDRLRELEVLRSRRYNVDPDLP